MVAAVQIIANKSNTTQLVHIADILSQTFQNIEERHQGISLPGIPCGFYDLDAMTSAFQRSDLIIVAGRPSMGKSSLCLGIAYNTAILHWEEDVYVAECPEVGTASQGDYAALGGKKFIGDPKQPTFSVCQLVGDEYQVTKFTGNDLIISPTFPNLKLTAQQVFDSAL